MPDELLGVADQVLEHGSLGGSKCTLSRCRVTSLAAGPTPKAAVWMTGSAVSDVRVPTAQVDVTYLFYPARAADTFAHHSSREGVGCHRRLVQDGRPLEADARPTQG